MRNCRVETHPNSRRQQGPGPWRAKRNQRKPSRFGRDISLRTIYDLELFFASLHFGEARDERETLKHETTERNFPLLPKH